MDFIKVAYLEFGQFNNTCAFNNMNSNALCKGKANYIWTLEILNDRNNFFYREKTNQKVYYHRTCHLLLNNFLNDSHHISETMLYNFDRNFKWVFLFIRTQNWTSLSPFYQVKLFNEVVVHCYEACKDPSYDTMKYEQQ